MRSKRGLGWLILFLLALAAETGYCFLHPVAYFDTMAYVSLQRSIQGENDFGAVGAGCGAALPGAYAGCGAVRSSEVFAQAAALSPSEYRMFLRFYTVKPLYNRLAAFFSLAFRRDSWWALRSISAGSFALLGLLLVVWLRRLVSPAIASAGALCLMSLPGVIAIGRGLLPDALLTLLVLLGAYIVVCWPMRWWAGAAILMLATLVRSDALLFAVLLGAVTIFRRSPSGTVRWTRLAVLLGSATAWWLALGAATGALPWRVLFVHSFLAWTPPAAYLALKVSVREYLGVMRSNGVRTVLFCLPLPGLLAVLALHKRRRWTAMQEVVWAGLVAVTLRVLLYPGVEERYYVWLTLLAGVGALATVAAATADAA